MDTTERREELGTNSMRETIQHLTIATSDRTESLTPFDSWMEIESSSGSRNVNTVNNCVYRNSELSVNIDYSLSNDGKMEEENPDNSQAVFVIPQ